MPAYLLASSDGAAVRLIAETSKRPLILLCEHASNRVPARLANLGLNDTDIQRHPAVDIGAAAVTELLATRLGCAAVMCNFSRLVVDCNRDLDQPSLMTIEEDGLQVPGNRNIPPAERQARIDEIYKPFHSMAEQEIERLERQSGQAVLVIGMHSFSPQYRAAPLPRPWHIGVMWHHDHKTATALLDYLRSFPELEVGDNQPYSMVPAPGKPSVTHTLERHAGRHGRPCVQIEIRNDEIITERGVHRYAELLARFFLNNTSV